MPPAGSSVTNIGFESRLPFGPGSDFDVAIAHEELFSKAAARGYSKYAGRTIPLGSLELKELGLEGLTELTDKYSHEMTFMIYKSMEYILERGAYLPIPLE